MVDGANRRPPEGDDGPSGADGPSGEFRTGLQRTRGPDSRRQQRRAGCDDEPGASSRSAGAAGPAVYHQHHHRHGLGEKPGTVRKRSSRHPHSLSTGFQPCRASRSGLPPAVGRGSDGTGSMAEFHRRMPSAGYPRHSRQRPNNARQFPRISAAGTGQPNDVSPSHVSLCAGRKLRRQIHPARSAAGPRTRGRHNEVRQCFSGRS